MFCYAPAAFAEGGACWERASDAGGAGEGERASGRAEEPEALVRGAAESLRGACPERTGVGGPAATA